MRYCYTTKNLFNLKLGMSYRNVSECVTMYNATIRSVTQMVDSMASHAYAYAYVRESSVTMFH